MQKAPRLEHIKAVPSPVLPVFSTHVTAQHSTAQHSTAQHSAALLLKNS